FTRDGDPGPGWATVGLDYLRTRTAIGFDGLDTIQAAFVPILNDTISEGVEKVLLFLKDPTGGPALGSRSMAVLLIFDNACPGGDDYLNAGSGNDSPASGGGVYGNEGNDLLVADLGLDLLNGGEGLDRVFSTAGYNFVLSDTQLKHWTQTFDPQSGNLVTTDL